MRPGDQGAARFRADMVAAVVSMVVRFRRSRAVERQQLKWFTYAGRRSCRFWCWSISSRMPPCATSSFGLFLAFVMPVAPLRW